MSEKPREEWQPTGNFSLDIADMSAIHQDMLPPKTKLEYKKEEYQELAAILGASVHHLEQDDLTNGVEIITASGIRAALSRAVKMALEGVSDEKSIQIMTSASAALGQEGNVWASFSAKKALEATIRRGVGTGSDVMAAYWRMISKRYGEDQLYTIANSDASMKTLVTITRAWALGEVSEKLRDLGAHFDDYTHGTQGIPSLTEDLFEFHPNGVAINSKYRDFFLSNLQSEKAVCPAGHMIGDPSHDAETASIIPVRQYARIILDKWQQARQKDGKTL